MTESTNSHKAQLDKAEREQVEDIVTQMRERVEDNVRFQLTRRELDDRPDRIDELETETKQLVEAIDLEATDGESWSEALDKYVTSVGYTIVNRLTALRCMEVREFIDEEVTVFKQNGLTPAAERLVQEEFLLEDEAILESYHNICDTFAEEIEILFDRSSAYSLIDPDNDTFEQTCSMLDDIPDAVWRADDVLGWIYEYYNRPAVEALEAKNTLEADDVGPANQFYTPHWVVRMLVDNSLGKLYLESTDQESSIPAADELPIEKRKSRAVTPDDTPGVTELCTYLIADDGDQDAPAFEHPSELRVIDPACGSGHFLLYAFDVLERIWWAETDLDRSEIPAKILKHNLYAVDIDLRSCQLSAFNLYLKARTRAEQENGDFEMPKVSIVCADARVAEVEEAVDVLDQITTEKKNVREALDKIIEQFQTTEALGSLLDVKNSLSEEFIHQQTDIMQWVSERPQTLNGFLKKLRKVVEKRTSDSFGEQNLRNFLNLLVVLTQNYDVALMNPPYGSRGRMPTPVKEYIRDNYKYTPEYYISFFEACDRLVKPQGRIGMLVPWSFMFNQSFEDFREDFVGTRGSFDFFAEFGYDVLDNATVGTVGTVVRSGNMSNNIGKFIRLHDVNKMNKEQRFLTSAFDRDTGDDVNRFYERDLSEFAMVPGAPLSYWVPRKLRSIYKSNRILDKKRSSDGQEGLGDLRQGLATGNDSRFLRYFWETDSTGWAPFAKGGADAWLLPRIKNSILWEKNGAEVRYYSGGNGTPSEELYFNKGLTYTVAKRSGRRFGYLPEGSIFGHKGSVFIPDRASWNALSYTNSHLFTYLMLTQTSERMWEIGFVSKVAWREELENIDDLERLSKEAVGHLVSKRQYDFISPHYSGPVLLDVLGVNAPLAQYDHPHQELRETIDITETAKSVSVDSSLQEIGIAAARHLERIEMDLQSCADAIDKAVFDCFDITDEQRETVLQEIALRTIEDPRSRKEYDPEAITEPSETFPEMIKDLLLHLVIRIVNQSDGIVPLSGIEDEAGLLSRIESEFERLFNGHATARLAEVDQILGSRTADQEAYPNLREWLENSLFDYHASTFDRTPILWRLTTERLVSDPKGEGFGCLIDYHQLDDGVFDRLQNRYLEPRKALLRERRSAANRRRGDGSLSTSKKAAAAEEYARCASGLDQVSVFEERLSELAQSSPREWPESNQQIAADAAQAVAEFREKTESRLETLSELADFDDINMSDLFSPSFYETVQENQDEWLNALDDLQYAFHAYAANGSKPVEARLYDLFEYYDDLVGSAHYASNGILFMTYYFEKYDDGEQAEIGKKDVSDYQPLLSELATDLKEYKHLADEIAEACDDIASDISSKWEDRALKEITTSGYQPNRKHGVEINIRPLADAEIVPKSVENDVL